jgi:hypothetical protein
MRGASAPRLRSIVLYHSGAIHSLSCEYTLAGDYDGPPPPPRVAGPWGLPYSFGSRGVRAKVITHIEMIFFLVYMHAFFALCKVAFWLGHQKKNA